MNISPFERQVKASHVPLEKLAGNAQLSQREKLSEVSRQFEAILVRQVLSEAQKPVFKSKLNNSSAAGEIYRDLLTNEMADQISRSGSLGIGRSLETQLQQQLPAESKSSKPPPHKLAEKPAQTNHLPKYD